MDRTDFKRTVLPECFCNLDRLFHAMDARGLDGIVATSPNNVYYLSGFNGVAHKSDEPRPYAVILSRHEPDHPVLVVADYYLATFLEQPSWIKDVRPFRAVMMGLDLTPSKSDINRFIPETGTGVDWMDAARSRFSFDMGGALRGALKDLGLDRGRVAFDDMAAGFRLRLDHVEIADGYDPLMDARAVKTQTELDLLQRSTRLNEAAIMQVTKSWNKDTTWRDLDHAYHRAVVDLGGFVRDPGGMVWGHPRGADPAIMLNAGLDDTAVPSGTHVMFDCHGTLDLYCWDGGKTWIVDGEPEGDARTLSTATADTAEALIGAMRPGVKISELQARGREVYRKAGAPSADDAVIFFHGLGLSHMDLELTRPDGSANGDWTLEENMVVPLHLLYPGGEFERSWLEEVVVITVDGGRPLFSWGFDPLTGS